MGIKVKAILVVPLVIVTIVGGLGVTAFAIAMLVGLPMRFNLPFPARLSGIAVVLAGFALLGWVLANRRLMDVVVSTFLTIRKIVTGALTADTPARAEPLVIRGPQRYVRNPMYLAVVVIVLGFWLLLDHTFLLLLAGLLVVWFNLILIPLEEKELRTIFGPHFEAYTKAVPRFFPTFRRYKG